MYLTAILFVFTAMWSRSTESSLRSSIVTCPVSLCADADHIFVAVPNQPRLFLFCGGQEQFCGTCRDGQEFDGQQRRCVAATGVATGIGQLVGGISCLI